MEKRKILIFASGTAASGGSGFEKLVEAQACGVLRGEIVAVVSQHENGGVRERARRLGIPFIHFPSPWTGERYQQIAHKSGADFFALSGWLRLVSGFDPKTHFNPQTVFNIHPGPIPKFGGAGLYGHRVHEAVIDAFRRGEITHTAICMHFLTEEYDQGPVFFRRDIKIYSGDTAETLAARVNISEHEYQPKITDMVVNGLIRWDGKNPNSLITPQNYSVYQSE